MAVLWTRAGKNELVQKTHETFAKEVVGQIKVNAGAPSCHGLRAQNEFGEYGGWGFGNLGS